MNEVVVVSFFPLPSCLPHLRAVLLFSTVATRGPPYCLRPHLFDPSFPPKLCCVADVFFFQTAPPGVPWSRDFSLSTLPFLTTLSSFDPPPPPPLMCFPFFFSPFPASKMLFSAPHNKIVLLPPAFRASPGLLIMSYYSHFLQSILSRGFLFRGGSDARGRNLSPLPWCCFFIPVPYSRLPA